MEPNEDFKLILPSPTVATNQAFKPNHRLFIVAIDYGTTFSSASYTVVDPRDPRQPEGYSLDKGDIHNINNYPSSPNKCTDTPTEICYKYLPKTRHERQQEKKAPINPNAGLSRFYWGREVQEALIQEEYADQDAFRTRWVKRPKLLLDNSPATQVYRDNLKKQVELLKNNGYIGHEDDLHLDFLTALLYHVKQRLERNRGFSSDDEVEFILCFPPTWTQRAERLMDHLLLEATSRAGFERRSVSGQVFKHFHVSEPEASAAFMLGSKNWSDSLTVSLPMGNSKMFPNNFIAKHCCDSHRCWWRHSRRNNSTHQVT
jgi:hypothetical protein